MYNPQSADMNFNNYPFMYLDSFKMHEFVLFIVKIDGYILFFRERQTWTCRM